MQIPFLYALTALIWGSTWLAITFQLGTVDPEVSVVYRFALASGILIAYSLIRRLRMRFTLREHAFMALQGLTLFSINYVLVYVAELHLASGYVAIVFSLIVVFNVLFGAAFLRNPVRPRVLLGGIIGIVGLGMVFPPISIPFFYVHRPRLTNIFRQFPHHAPGGEFSLKPSLGGGCR